MGLRPAAELDELCGTKSSCDFDAAAAHLLQKLSANKKSCELIEKISSNYLHFRTLVL